MSKLIIDLERLRKCDVIWAVGPEPGWVLMYGVIDGKELSIVEAANQWYPQDQPERAYAVACYSEDDYQELQAVVLREKGCLYDDSTGK